MTFSSFIVFAFYGCLFNQVLFLGLILVTGRISVVGSQYDEDVKPSKHDLVNSKKEIIEEILPPPPPLPRQNLLEPKVEQGPTIARADEDDIFVGEGVDYVIPGKDLSQSPLSEDMEESPRNKEKVSYFDEPAYGPVPPSQPVQPYAEWQESVC